MRLKLDYKMTIVTMSWREYDKDKNYIILCEEFYRLRRECKEHQWIWESSEPMYIDGIDYMAIAKNQAAWATLGQERLRTERALPAQAAIADHMGTAGDKVYMVTINYADKYSEFADSKSTPLFTFPVAEAVVLLSVRSLLPWASCRVTAPAPVDSSFNDHQDTRLVLRVLLLTTYLTAIL